MTLEQKILFIGNTGSGKSYLLNHLGGEFESDVSTTGDGVTTTYTTQVSRVFPNTKLIDTPGLIEESDARTKENARQIEDALKSGGYFKVVLVMGDSSGRIDRNTTILLKKLHDTLKERSIKIGFIFNKTPQDAFAKVESSAKGQIERYNKHVGDRISSYLVLKIADGAAADATKLDNSDRLTTYISDMAAHEVDPESILEGGMDFEPGELEWWECWWGEVKEFFGSGKVVGAVAKTLGVIVSVIQLKAWATKL